MINIEEIKDISQVKKALREKGVCVGKIAPDLYHSFKDKIPNSISKSGLVDFIKNPYAYKFGSQEKDSDAISFGRLVDCITLTPELLDSTYEITEAKVLSSKMKDEARARGLELVKKRDFDKAKLAAVLAGEELQKHAAHGRLVSQVAIWACMENIGAYTLEAPVVLCGMLDALVIEDDMLRIVDLKTTSANVNSKYELKNNTTKYLYGIQAAMYEDLCALAFKMPCDFNLLFVSSSAPPQTRFVYMPEKLLEYYRIFYRKKIVEFSEACARDSWGSKNLPPMEFYMSEWEINSLLEEIK